MAKIPVILARPDASCGKVFHHDRRAADEHRIVLEVWNRATGRQREGYRLAVFQCTRCGGFHVGQRRADRVAARTDEFSQQVLEEMLLHQSLGCIDDPEPVEEDELDQGFERLPVNHEPGAVARPFGL